MPTGFTEFLPLLSAGGTLDKRAFLHEPKKHAGAALLS